MYNNLYLDNLDFDIFIESIELTLDGIDCDNEISLLLEDGNTDDNKKKNIIMRAIDAIMKKIREIIDWIKSKLFGGENKKYEDFLKLADSKVSNIYVDFDIAPRKTYEKYLKIFNTISKNYDKLSADNKLEYMDDVREMINKKSEFEALQPKECLELFKNYDKLLRNYETLSNRVSARVKNKLDKGESYLNEQKTLSLISRIMNDIKICMSKLSAKKIVNSTSFKKSLGEWIASNPVDALAITAIVTTLGIHIGSGIKNHIDTKDVREFSKYVKNEREESRKRSIERINDYEKELSEAIHTKDRDERKRKLKTIRDKYSNKNTQYKNLGAYDEIDEKYKKQRKDIIDNVNLNDVQASRTAKKKLEEIDRLRKEDLKKVGKGNSN